MKTKKPRFLITDTVINSLQHSPLLLIGLEADGVCFITATTARARMKVLGRYCTDNSEQSEGLCLIRTESELVCYYDGEKTDYTVIPYSSDFPKRIKGIVDNSVIQGKIVTIIGLGSGGSKFAEMGARCGIENFILIDHDIVETSNICRSDYTCFDIGLYKTEALSRKLLSINPNINIEEHAESWTEMDDDQIERIIQSSSLIIEATDKHGTKVLTNGLCHDRVPVLYPRLYSEAKGGDIIFTLPNSGTPCYECIFSAIMTEMQDDENHREWDYTSDEPVSMPGLCVDINVVTCRAVKLALAILMKEEDPSMFEKVTEPGCNMLFIGNEAPYYIFDKPFQEVWANTEINPNCSCQTLR
jgi:molybdopterin/thiamine biosynthesis adenylyltransferase